jgi:hypothetical protein
MFLNPAMIPNTKNISVNQGDVPNLPSNTTPIPKPIKTASETEIPRLLKYASSLNARLFSLFIERKPSPHRKRFGA